MGKYPSAYLLAFNMNFHQLPIGFEVHPGAALPEQAYSEVPAVHDFRQLAFRKIGGNAALWLSASNRSVRIAVRALDRERLRTFAASWAGVEIDRLQHAHRGFLPAS